jgi:hypothetical protein
VIAFSALASRLRLDHARTCFQTTQETRCADVGPEAWRELDEPTRWATAYDTLRPFDDIRGRGPAPSGVEVEVTQRVSLGNGSGPRVIRVFSSGFEPSWDIIAIDDAEFRGALPARCVVLGDSAGTAGAITFRVRAQLSDLPLMLTPPFLELTEAEEEALATPLAGSLVVRAMTGNEGAPCPSTSGRGKQTSGEIRSSDAASRFASRRQPTFVR